MNPSYKPKINPSSSQSYRQPYPSKPQSSSKIPLNPNQQAFNTKNNRNNYPKPQIKSSLINEEEIEIKIPTPYPVARYMTLDDPKLANSEYTHILNEKYPPRKYLKHNQHSYNKISKPNEEISFRLYNPKGNFSDFNLKTLTYNNEAIDETKITNLSDALEIIDRLKTKGIEYELTNNQNIEKANEIITQLKKQNEGYMNQINTGYNNMRIVENKYGIDIDHPDPEEPINLVINNFRDRWLKKNMFQGLAYRTFRQKNIKYGYYNLLLKQSSLLKLKAFIGFEKNQNFEQFTRAMTKKRKLKTGKNVLSGLKHNIICNEGVRKYRRFQDNGYKVLYVKELKLKVFNNKISKSLNKKGGIHYYGKTTGKVMRILRANALHNNKIKKTGEYDIGLGSTNNNKKQNINYLSYTKALSKKYQDNFTPELKDSKIKAIQQLKFGYDKMDYYQQNKLINQNIQDKSVLLSHYFKLWKSGSEENLKILTGNMAMRCNSLRQFFTQARKAYKRKHYNMNKDSVTMRAVNAITFLNNTRYRIHHKQKKKQFKAITPKLIISSVLKKMLALSQCDPLIRFNRVKKRIIFTEYIDLLHQTKNAKKQKDNIVAKHQRFKKMGPNINYRKFFLQLKKIFQIKHRFYCIKHLVDKHNLHKNLRIMLTYSFKNREKKLRCYYENTIAYIKKIVQEKTGMINKLEYDNNDLAMHYEELLGKLNATCLEKETLQKMIYDLKIKNEKEKKQLKEILEANGNDVQSLQLTIENTENLLSQAIHREEQGQKKYCVDIQNAIKLNKNLNEIINKKNQQILELNDRNRKTNQFSIVEKQKLNQENLMMGNDLTYTIENKEKENIILQQQNERMSKDMINHFGIDMEKSNKLSRDMQSYGKLENSNLNQ